jgi:hypothetical protein
MSELRERQRARIEEIAAYEHGWYGPNDGDPIAPEAIAFAREWVETESDDELARWAVCAMADDGALCFERTDGRHDAVHVGVDRIAYFVCADLRGWSAWIEVDREPPHMLRELDAEAMR